MERKYALTPEHREQMRPWAERWIAHALNCDPLTEVDKGALRVAVLGLYEAAGLPAPQHIVFVPSPLVLAFAGGFAAGLWYLSRKRTAIRNAMRAAQEATLAATLDATRGATRAATWAATLEATRAATLEATRAATWEATLAATQAATLDATWEATLAATREATQEATLDATWEATREATLDATREATWEATQAATREATRERDVQVNLLLHCAALHQQMWDGGNQWPGYPAMLSFFRHVVGLQLPEYHSWQHYEAAAIHGGPRIMHSQFCMISDRPKYIRQDERHRPHCLTGPFCEWRDGWKLYAIHGVRVPAWMIEHPEQITCAKIDAEPNAEVRRIMIEQYGVGRYLLDAGAEEIDVGAEDDPTRGLRGARLYRRRDTLAVRMRNSTPEPDGIVREYFLSVHPELRPLLDDDGSLGEPQALTVRNAIASTFGLRGEEYAPEVET